MDVAVTEGFAGNIALKTAEGTARQIGEYLRSAMDRTWATRLGYLFAHSAFRLLREKMDPRKVNGGVFLLRHRFITPGILAGLARLRPIRGSPSA